MKPATAESYQERIGRVLLHISSHLDQPYRLDTLAAVAHFSPFHFHRVFRGMVGEWVKEHVRRLRLERAAARLRGTGLSVLDIALEAGYEAHESFTRAFAGMYRLPPSEFRKSSEAGAPAGLPPIAPAAAYRTARLEDLRILYVRHLGPYGQVGEAWSRLMPWGGMRGLLGPSMRLVGVVHETALRRRHRGEPSGGTRRRYRRGPDPRGRLRRRPAHRPLQPHLRFLRASVRHLAAPTGPGTARRAGPRVLFRFTGHHAAREVADRVVAAAHGRVSEC